MSLPPEAVQAAAEAISRELISGNDVLGWMDSDDVLARVALEAAAPLIRAAERERCALIVHAKALTYDGLTRDRLLSVAGLIREEAAT